MLSQKHIVVFGTNEAREGEEERANVLKDWLVPFALQWIFIFFRKPTIHLDDNNNNDNIIVVSLCALFMCLLLFFGKHFSKCTTYIYYNGIAQRYATVMYIWIRIELASIAQYRSSHKQDTPTHIYKQMLKFVFGWAVGRFSVQLVVSSSNARRFYLFPHLLLLLSS